MGTSSGASKEGEGFPDTNESALTPIQDQDQGTTRLPALQVEIALAIAKQELGRLQDLSSAKEFHEKAAALEKLIEARK